LSSADIFHRLSRRREQAVASRDEFTVRFWGVRGSIACPGSQFMRYGGNTSCIEVRCGGRLLIFDGGTGLRPLGLELKREQPLDADLFFTHTHLDHIVGIPFFMPLFDPVNTFRLWAGHLGPTGSMRQVLCTMMTAPLFPVPPEIFTASTSYIDFTAGEALAPQPGVTLRTAHLNHPNGATGYRIEFAGKSVCYVTDTEHEPGQLDGTIVDLVRGADIFIYDSTYTEEEFPRYVGWGHSTWQEGIRLAEAAGVGQFVAFHHDPSHDDEFMDRVAADVARRRAGSLVAHEGLTLTP
jgi:phosphoribosyl 1,2-cyclic phosphodiesterase